MNASIKKRTREGMVLGFWFAAWECLCRAAENLAPHSSTRPQGRLPARKDSSPLGLGEGRHQLHVLFFLEKILGTWAEVTYFEDRIMECF